MTATATWPRPRRTVTTSCSACSPALTRCSSPADAATPAAWHRSSTTTSPTACPLPGSRSRRLPSRLTSTPPCSRAARSRARAPTAPGTDAAVHLVTPELYFPDNEDGISAATNTKNGHYELVNLPVSSFDVVFGCGRFGPQWYRSQTGPDGAIAISTAAGVTARVNARLTLAGAISGTVTNSAGKPLSNQCVQASPAGSTGLLNVTGLGFTSNSGFYRIGGLLAGRYVVQFTNCGLGGRTFATQWYKNQANANSATIISVKAGATTRRIDGKLAVGGVLTGKVTGPSGQPQNNVCVEASSPARANEEAISSKSGSYRLAGLATGNYSLTFIPCGGGSLKNLARQTRPGLVHVTAPRTTVVPSVRLVAGGEIAGRLVGPEGNAPAGDTCVEVQPASGGSGGSGRPDLVLTGSRAGLPVLHAV